MKLPSLKRTLLIGGIGLAIPLVALAARPMLGGPDGCERPMSMAQGPGPEFGPGPEMGMPPLPHMLRRLDLSEAQRDKVFELLHAQAPRLRDQAKSLRQARTELQTLSRSEDFDAKRAQELSQSAASTLAAMALERARMENQVFKLLTPEQRQNLQAWSASMDQAPWDRFGRHGRPD